MVDSDDLDPGLQKSATGAASFRPPPIAGRFAKDAGNSPPGSVRLPGYNGKDYHDKLEGRERLIQLSPLTGCSRARAQGSNEELDVGGLWQEIIGPLEASGRTWRQAGEVDMTYRPCRPAL